MARRTTWMAAVIIANLITPYGVNAQSQFSLMTWGDPWGGHGLLPTPNIGFVQIAAGGYRYCNGEGGQGCPGHFPCNCHSLGFSLALRETGSIEVWGNIYSDNIAAIPLPNSDYIAIAAGIHHALAVRSDSSVAAWGDNSQGQCNVPAPNSGFQQVAGGGFHTLALRTDGSISAWGAGGTNSGIDLEQGQSIQPLLNFNFIAIAAGGLHSLGLKADGSIVAWGAGTSNTGQYPNYGQSIVPSLNSGFVAIAAGDLHSVGLKADGSIVAWGAGTTNTGQYPEFGQSMTPPVNQGFTAVAASGLHTVGLRSDHSVAVWGDNSYGEGEPPLTNADIVRIAAGGSHNVALRLVEPGDMNCDNAVNLADVPHFVEALLDTGIFTGCDINRADANADQVIDGRDIQPFVALLIGN